MLNIIIVYDNTNYSKKIVVFFSCIIILGRRRANLISCLTLRFTYAKDVNIYFFHVLTALVGLGFLIVDFSRSNSDTPHSIGLRSTNDRPIAENSDKTQKIKRDRHPCPGGIPTRNTIKRTVADTVLRRLGHWDQRLRHTGLCQ